MKRKFFYIVLLLGATLASCHENVVYTPYEGGGDSGDNPPVNRDIAVAIPPDPLDPKIATVTTINGDAFHLFGEKNSSGLAIRADEILIRTAQGEATDVRLNEQSLPVFITAPNGVTFQLEWLTDRKAALTVVEPVNGEQLNTVVDFDNPEQFALRSAVAGTAGNGPRTGKASLSVRPAGGTFEKGGRPATLPDTKYAGDRKAYLFLNRCGVPADASCWVEVYDTQAGYISRLRAVKVSTGIYEVTVPYGIEPGVIEGLPEFCHNAAEIMGHVCMANELVGIVNKQLMCFYMSAAIASAGVTLPAAAMFEAGCAGVSGALDLYCNTIGYGAQAGGPSLADGLCGVADFVNQYKVPVVLLPVVDGLPTAIYGQSVTVYPEDPAIANMEVTWGGDSQILSFTLSPSAPLEGVDYTAVATIGCLPVGAEVVMSIVGSDEYTDTQSYTVTDNQVDYVATLEVPGAEAGVRDVCTVEVILPSGDRLTKRASLVFQ